MLLENLKGLASRYQFLFMFLFLIDLLLEDTHPHRNRQPTTIDFAATECPCPRT